MARPVIKWAGSKKKLLPTLREYWQCQNMRYVEPFAGSACLFFDLEPTKAILGDVNEELIAAYSAIRRSPIDVYKTFARHSNDADTYYCVRAKRRQGLTSVQQAARFLYLNRYCFNGIYRTNAAGEFNVPYGGRRSGQPPTLDEFVEAAQLLRRARLVAKDFSKVLEMVEPGDFVYLDPPYRVSTRRVFREYDRATFSETDLTRLREWLIRLDRMGVPFVVSYAESPEAKVLAKGFYSRRVRVRRNIAGFTSSRRLASELVVSNVHK